MSNEIDDTTDEATPSSYSSSTPAAATNRKAITAPGGGVGRRKEAVARVRLVPGSGRWVVNGKPLEVYFPNKVHQQSVAEPFKIVGAEGTYDVFARINGGGTSGQEEGSKNKPQQASKYRGALARRLWESDFRL